MKIQMLTAIAGVRWSASPGQVIDMDVVTAKRLIKTGQAIEVATKKPEIEVAIQPEPENAARQTARAKRSKTHV